MRGLPGIRGTYQGLTATMMKQGSNQAIRFTVMESLKELYRGKDNVDKPVPKVIVGIFGIIAGAASVFGNTPLDVIKTRMQVTHWFVRCLIAGISDYRSWQSVTERQRNLFTSFDKMRQDMIDHQLVDEAYFHTRGASLREARIGKVVLGLLR